MVSSKQWRKPTRGCVGNGLRVIVGAVVSGGGRIVVKTRNQQVTLRPRMDGTTAVEDVHAIDWPAGTAITVEIDPAYPAGRNRALLMGATGNRTCALKRSAITGHRRHFWFDVNHLALNMLSALPTDKRSRGSSGDSIGAPTVRSVKLVTDRFGKGRSAGMSRYPRRGSCLQLLQEHSAKANQAEATRPMGRDAWKRAKLTDGYALRRREVFDTMNFRAQRSHISSNAGRQRANRRQPR